jgi:hypothetical protein
MRPCRASVRGLLVGLATRNRWDIRLPASWPWLWLGFGPEVWVWTGLFGVLFGAAHFFCVVARWLTCDGPLLLAPSPLRGEGWDEGRVLQRPSSCWLVARLLTCGGLSLACRPASSFSLLAHATAGSGGERRSRPEGRRAGCPESREGTKRNGLSSPPTLQALTLEGLGTDRTLPVRPSATPRRRRSLRVGRGCRGLCRLRLLPCGGCFSAAFPSICCSRCCEPSRFCLSSRRRPEALFNRRRSGHPVTSVHGGRDSLPLPLLDPACAGMTSRKRGADTSPWACLLIGVRDYPGQRRQCPA